MTWDGDGERPARTLPETSFPPEDRPPRAETGPQILSGPWPLSSAREMDRRPMTGGGAFRGDHGDGSGVRHVRRRGHPPDGPRPRAAVLLLLPHLPGGLHRPGAGDPATPMARPLQPRGRNPPFRRRFRAGRGLVARRDRGTLEPRLLPPGDAGPV